MKKKEQIISLKRHQDRMQDEIYQLQEIIIKNRNAIEKLEAKNTKPTPTEEASTDWENLLNADEVGIACDNLLLWKDNTRVLNRLIHERIKPLLSRIEELEAEQERTIDVPFEIDEDDIFLFNGYVYLNNYLYDQNIDQTKIKSIKLIMKSEDE